MRAASRLGRIGSQRLDRASSISSTSGTHATSRTGTANDGPPPRTSIAPAERTAGLPLPVQPRAKPRVPRPALVLHRAAADDEASSEGTGRRTALAAFLAQPESGRTRAALFRTLAAIDDRAERHIRLVP